MAIGTKLPRIRLPALRVKAKITSETVKEACLIAGYMMVLRGLWLIYPPIMWIIGGLALFWFGLPGKKGNKWA